MTNPNPLARVGLVLILVIATSAVFTFSACPPLDLFYQIVSQGGVDYEETAYYAQFQTPQTTAYLGTFTPGDDFWRVTENQVEIGIDTENEIVTGTGKQVHVKDPAYAEDTGETITYQFTFEGTYEVDMKSITGIAHITGGKVCTANCAGVDNYDLDYYANWTASLSEDETTLWGHVDQMGDYGDFTASK